MYIHIKPPTSPIALDCKQIEGRGYAFHLVSLTFNTVSGTKKELKPYSLKFTENTECSWIIEYTGQ